MTTTMTRNERAENGGPPRLLPATLRVEKKGPKQWCATVTAGESVRIEVVRDYFVDAMTMAIRYAGYAGLEITNEDWNPQNDSNEARL